MDIALNAKQIKSSHAYFLWLYPIQFQALPLFYSISPKPVWPIILVSILQSKIEVVYTTHLWCHNYNISSSTYTNTPYFITIYPNILRKWTPNKIDRICYLVCVFSCFLLWVVYLLLINDQIQHMSLFLFFWRFCLAFSHRNAIHVG